MHSRQFLVSILWLEKMWWAVNLPEDHEDDRSSVQRLDTLLKTSELFTSWSLEARSTGWPVTGRVATPGGKEGWPAESRSTAQGREATDSITQLSVYRFQHSEYRIHHYILYIRTGSVWFGFTCKQVLQNADRRRNHIRYPGYCHSHHYIIFFFSSGMA